MSKLFINISTSVRTYNVTITFEFCSTGQVLLSHVYVGSPEVGIFGAG